MRLTIRRSTVSNGARTLANALREAGVSVILTDRNAITRRRLTLNWGSTAPLTSQGRIFNNPQAVAVARDKLRTFNMLRENNVRIPRYWVNRDEAQAARGKSILLERHSLTGQSGAGIKVKRKDDALEAAPLYVEYIKKVKEFRVHVFNGEAIFVQDKRRESDVEQTADEKLIRNRDNGWVFCVTDINEPAGLRELAVSACRALQLDFGAVDMVQSQDGTLYVLEVNTKPGIESPTLITAYVEATKRAISNERSNGARRAG